MNKVMLSGNITNVNTYYTKNQMPITRYTLAVKKSEAARKVSFIRCVTFNELAEAAAKFVKGDTIEVEGCITTGSYVDKITQLTVYTTDVTVDKQHKINSDKLVDPETASANIPNGPIHQAPMMQQPPVEANTGICDNNNAFLNIPDGIPEELFVS